MKQTKEGDTIEAEIIIYGYPEMTGLDRTDLREWIAEQAAYLLENPDLADRYVARKIKVKS